MKIMKRKAEDQREEKEKRIRKRKRRIVQRLGED